jgi:hypothetical protein
MENAEGERQRAAMRKADGLKVVWVVWSYARVAQAGR